MTVHDLAYWPRQISLGLVRLWQFNGPVLALRITLLNLMRRRRTLQVRLYGFDLVLRTGTPDLAVALDSLGEEFASLAGQPDPGGLIIDAGGYIGTAAMKLGAMFPASRVICIEPAAANLALLRDNAGALPNVAILEAALAATEGEVELRDAGSGEWGFSTVAAGQPLARVAALTIETLLAHAGSDRIFILKLDVEGAEREIFAHAGAWMDKVDILVAELHEQLAPGATAAFEQATAGRLNARLPGEKMLSVRTRG